MKTLCKLILVAAISILATAVLQGYISVPEHIAQYIPKDVRFSEQEAPWESFFSVFGVLYAILVGFLIVKVLDRFTSLSKSIEGELNAVQDVRDLLVYFEDHQDPAKYRLLTHLQNYVRAVSEKEWKAMSSRLRMKRIDSDTTEELLDMMRTANHLKVENQSDQMALSCMINKLGEITSFRTARIGQAHERLPARLKGLLLFMSLILIAGFVVMDISNPVLHLAMVASVAIAVHLVVSVIFDLDHPLTGTWNVSRAPLDDAREVFGRELIQFSDPGMRQPQRIPA